MGAAATWLGRRRPVLSSEQEVNPLRVFRASVIAAIVIVFVATPAWATAKPAAPRNEAAADRYNRYLKVETSKHISATWTCETQLGRPRISARSPWKPHSASFRSAQLELWKGNHARCVRSLHARADAIRTGNYSRLSDRDLYELADTAIRHGGIYSIGWGDASPIVRGACYEAVSRAFARYGTSSWARFIVNRESGCNPAAQNTTYAKCWRWSTCERATGISQMIPSIHDWVDYDRVQRDLRYAVQVFVRLSDGGRTTGPWSM